MEPQQDPLLATLPPKLRTYVERMASAGQYTDAADYVKSLIREDLERRSQLWLEDLVLQSLNDPRAPHEEGPEFWRDLESGLSTAAPRKR